MMWYVYCRCIASGRDDCVNKTFETPQAAIQHIAKCYAIDKDLGQLGVLLHEETLNRAGAVYPRQLTTESRR